MAPTSPFPHSPERRGPILMLRGVASIAGASWAPGMLLALRDELGERALALPGCYASVYEGVTDG